MALSSAPRIALACATVLLFALPTAAQTRYAVIIGGLGGSPEYSRTLQKYIFDAHAALTGPLGLEANNVTVLTEPSIAESSVVNGIANAENIRTTFAELATQMTAEDHIYIILFGHGSFDGSKAMLNIARRDLSSFDYAGLINSLSAERIVFINTASASSPFIDALSAPDRIIITATRSGTQRNQTIFPQFLVEALSSPAADMDRDGSLSVLELYNYAALQTTGHFEENGNLATEHALLDDSGDGEGSRVEDVTSGSDGHLASFTYLRRAALAGTIEDQQGWDALEQQIAALKSRKSTMDIDDYYDELEVLMVQLAKLSLGQN